MQLPQSCISPTIHIGQEIQCLLYTGFFYKRISYLASGICAGKSWLLVEFLVSDYFEAGGQRVGTQFFF